MEQVLAEIEELAELKFTVEVIAWKCGIDENTLRREIRGKMSPMANAYLRGKFKAEYAFRRQVLDLAKAGSPQAELLLIELSEKQEGNE